MLVRVLVLWEGEGWKGIDGGHTDGCFDSLLGLGARLGGVFVHSRLWHRGQGFRACSVS